MSRNQLHYIENEPIIYEYGKVFINDFYISVMPTPNRESVIVDILDQGRKLEFKKGDALVLSDKTTRIEFTGIAINGIRLTINTKWG